MRSSRREKQDARRRQEQEYRDQLIERTVPPIERQLVPHSVNAAKPILSLTKEASKNSDVPRVVVSRSNLVLVILAYGLGAVGLGINAWFAWNRGSTLIDKSLMFSLGFIAEATLFYLPSQTASLWGQRRWGGSCIASIVCVFLFVFALTNSLGFASFNHNEVNTLKAERITPAVADAQRRLDTLSGSRKDECLKRGDKCRLLEKDEQIAIQALREARERVSESADPPAASAAKLVAWVSLNRFHPSADDVAMLGLLLLTLLPQLGGLIFLVARS